MAKKKNEVNLYLGLTMKLFDDYMAWSKMAKQVFTSKEEDRFLRSSHLSECMKASAFAFYECYRCETHLFAEVVRLDAIKNLNCIEIRVRKLESKK